MVNRFLPLFLAVFALVVLSGTAVLADDKPGTHEGVVVSAAAGKLTMTDKDGKEHTHAVPPDAAISCDGKACKLEDLKKGFKVRVTVEKVGEKTQVTKIDAQKA